MDKHYDYIITGAGCAGLSLLMRLLQEPNLNKKNILVIDQSHKKENDRTWCFWEKENDLFQGIVEHNWSRVNFYSNTFSAELDLHPYQYKMIKGIDFYNYVFEFAQQFSNVVFRFEKVIAIKTENDKAIVVLELEHLTADYIFNSILFDKPLLKKHEYYLLQHFKGWVIETEQPCFDPSMATFMDFRVSQQYGTTFMYVMPTSTTKALVEYTLFTEKILQQAEYEIALKEYISTTLHINNYTIEQEEFGIIPMTNYQFPLQNGRMINIGIAGGQAKGSSGYAFKFIQKRTKELVELLVNNQPPVVKKSLLNKKFHLYDSVLLHVLHHKKMEGSEIFAQIFKKNKPETVLNFLDNESSLADDLKIMGSVPSGIFLTAAFKEMFR